MILKDFSSLNDSMTLIRHLQLFMCLGSIQALEKVILCVSHLKTLLAQLRFRNSEWDLAAVVAEAATWPSDRDNLDRGVPFILFCIVSVVEAVTVISLSDIQAHAFLETSHTLCNPERGQWKEALVLSLL